MTKQIQSDRPGAIVLGGNFVGLGIARSLGVHGIPVWVIDSDRSKSSAQYSRYTKRFIESNEPVAELLLRENQLHELTGWLVFAVYDEYVEQVSANHDTLSSVFRLTTPREEVTRFALDKRLTYRKADELGIDTPWTLASESWEHIERFPIPYPVILKPAINHHFFPQTNLKVLKAANAEELQQRYEQMRRYIPANEILVQECIPGSGENQFSFCGVFENGHAYASLVARRRRQYPVEFGNASSFVETASQPVVTVAGQRFLESIAFDGMAEIEFKFDARDGKYKLLDFNPRPWGWHSMGKTAGMDFAYLLWRRMQGHDVKRIDTYGKAAWIREITDFIAIAKSRDRMAQLKVLLAALRSGKVTLAAFSITDPIPFFAEFALWGYSGLSRQKKATEFLSHAVNAECIESCRNQ